ncbi:alpha/beta hydrolase [Streptomyces rubiginosohelvolus]|uniref:alpha/beta hydrolase n=1 Tax=Streptomyces rubiginosohelvolus TaxID=67362 RepID=UPI003675A218
MSGRTRHLLDDELSIVGDLLEQPARNVATIVADFTFDRHGKYRRGAVFARSLRDAGIAAYRFDTEGGGLAGRSADWAPDPWGFMASQVDRARAAVTREHPQGARHLLIGVGIGGVTTVLSATRTPPDALVLISADLLQDVRFVVNGVAGVRRGEQLLPSRVFRSRERLRPRDLLAELKIPVLCVNGGLDPRFELAENNLSTHGAEVAAVLDVADPLQTNRATARTAEIIRDWAAGLSTLPDNS